MPSSDIHNISSSYSFKTVYEICSEICESNETKSLKWILNNRVPKYANN